MIDESAPGGASLQDFLAGRIDPALFGHREHVRMAFELLERADFIDAVAGYAGALRRILERAGRPGSFSPTVTVAYLSLIAERMGMRPGASFEELIAAHPELLRRDLLLEWYTPEQLCSPLARRAFLMPAP